MVIQSYRSFAARLAGAAAVAIALSIASMASVQAQEINAQTFLANPPSILDKNKDGGPSLVGQVRDLAVANPATLTSILGLLPTASKDQKAAIAAGLAQAAKIVIRNNVPYATQIQQSIADTKDPEFVTAYAGAAGDQPIGAGAGAGAGSAGASGGQTSSTGGGVTGTGSAQTISGNSTPTGNGFSFTPSTSGGGGSTTGGTTTGSTTTNSTTSFLTTAVSQ